jgi:glycosyltransferase involved in cell wall biosynthesis
MRIALITANYQPATAPCGVGDYTRCLREALEALGHQGLVLTSVRTRTTEQDVHRLPGRWDSHDTLAAWRILRAARPDAVLLQYTPEHYGFGLAFKLLPLLLRWGAAAPRTVTTFHTLIGGRWVSRPYAALLAATSRLLISTNGELTDLFRRRLPWWRAKLHEIPIGANIPAPRLGPAAARQRLRRSLGLETEAPVVATFGFPAPGKGLETLFRALRRLGDNRPVHLTCIGETREQDRAHRAQLETLADQLGLGGRVHWTGAVPDQDAADLLSGADAYVVPYDEGASLRRGTLLAGFRVGVPVVTTTPRYPDPALRSGETILAVPPRSPEALAQGIQGLLGDPGLQERIRQGMRAVQSRFEWPAIAAAHVALLERDTAACGQPG